MVRHCKLIVKVGNVLTDFGANELLLDADGLMQKLLSSVVLLLLPQLDCHTLHGSRFLVGGSLLLFSLFGGVTDAASHTEPVFAAVVYDAGALRFD